MIVDHFCVTNGLSPSTVDALTDYVVDGGRLIFYSWQLAEERSADLLRPLAQALGVQYQECLLIRCVRPISALDAYPAFWWKDSHALFTSPLPVPEFVQRGVNLVNPLDDGAEPLGTTR